ncbi:MAG: penicillin-insensitive murein endopeptidase [Solirubrobacterales bacterium]
MVSEPGDRPALAQSPATASTIGVEQVEQGPLDAGSVSLGTPQRGALVRGVQLAPEGPDFFTWDFPLKQSPNRPWRRWAAGRTIAIVLVVIAEYRAAHPAAPRVGIADLSRPHGGDFGKRFGGLGHASHQNGTDVDILYPRRDLQELVPSKVAQIDRLLAQDLVDRFVAAGAEFVFVGPHTKLGGPRKIVQKLVFHDDHMHVRFFARHGGRTG